jgi:hypothetical protein
LELKSKTDSNVPWERMQYFGAGELRKELFAIHVLFIIPEK